MRYAVYVKFKDLHGEECWSGNNDRAAESREIAEQETVKFIKSTFQIKKVLKVISFEYENDEDAPSFCEETERIDKEERKEFALVEIADAVRGLQLHGSPMQCNNVPWPITAAMIISAIAMLSNLLLLLRLSL